MITDVYTRKLLNLEIIMSAGPGGSCIDHDPWEGFQFGWGVWRSRREMEDRWAWGDTEDPGGSIDWTAKDSRRDNAGKENGVHIDTILLQCTISSIAVKIEVKYSLVYFRIIQNIVFTARETWCARLRMFLITWYVALIMRTRRINISGAVVRITVTIILKHHNQILER